MDNSYVRSAKSNRASSTKRKIVMTQILCIPPLATDPREVDFHLQSAEAEDDRQGDLLRHPQLEAPQHGHGQDDDSRVDDQVHDARAQIHLSLVPALPHL